MNDCIEVSFKGYLLTAMAVPEGDRFAALLVVKLPIGDQLATGLLDRFENPYVAKQFAIEYGIDQINSYVQVAGY